jgi:hypothetical protein
MVVPIIASSNKTTLKVLSSGTEAYPAYLTIGNIPKDIRRKPSSHAQLLFAYLPTVQFKTATTSQKNICLAKARAFHYTMSHIFKSLKTVGKQGKLMIGGNGEVRNCYPVIAAYVADYPEQCLVSCTRYTHCPICICPPDKLGLFGDYDHRQSRETLKTLSNANSARTIGEAEEILQKGGVTAIHSPFWEGLPFADIHSCITPDILHQLYQGLIKHLTTWIQHIIGQTELDHRLQRLPPNHQTRIFKHGIQEFSRMSGNEHQQLAKQLLGRLIGRAPPAMIRASRALLNFLYLAQYQSHSDATLVYLEKALRKFHKDKEVLIQLGGKEGT